MTYILNFGHRLTCKNNQEIAVILNKPWMDYFWKKYKTMLKSTQVPVPTKTKIYFISSCFI